MSLEKSLIIIKPDSFIKGNIGKIISEFENKGFNIIALKVLVFSVDMAKEFYQEHAQRVFFQDLVSFITSGPCVLVVIEKENCIIESRELIGATNPKEAKEGTIRAMFAESIDSNAIHGSDSSVSAKREIGMLFTDLV